MALSRWAEWPLDKPLPAAAPARRHAQDPPMRLLIAALLLLAAPAAAQTQSETMTAPQHELPPPPVAQQRPYSYERHGVRIEDPYHWLRDDSYPVVDDPDVLAYLRAENAYYEAAMA